MNFDTGFVTLRLEIEYWDYRRDLYDLEDPKAVAELARDVLASHNTKGYRSTVIKTRYLIRFREFGVAECPSYLA